MIFRVLLVLLVLIAAAPIAGAAPPARLWDHWLPQRPAIDASIDHGAWQGFLDRYLRPGDDGINRLAYGAVSADDRAALDAYVDRLSAFDIVTFERPEQMAYWINLYNALTVIVVLDHYPVDSIRDIDISPGVFSNGPWGKVLIAVDGERLGLNDIEHRILRPIWRDPRVHYALNCASIGCPNLSPKAYRGADIDEQLTMAAMDYINDPRGVAIEDGRLIVSSLFEWYMDDFGERDEDVIHHVMAYAEPELAMKLRRFERIDDDRYDWRLNDIAD